MKQIKLVPYGFQCTLAECPPGLFLFNDEVCFKSEYLTGISPDAYCENGEAFWGGTTLISERDKLLVQPLIIEVEK